MNIIVRKTANWETNHQTMHHDDSSHHDYHHQHDYDHSQTHDNTGMIGTKRRTCRDPKTHKMVHHDHYALRKLDHCHNWTAPMRRASYGKAKKWSTSSAYACFSQPTGSRPVMTELTTSYSQKHHDRQDHHEQRPQQRQQGQTHRIKLQHTTMASRTRQKGRASNGLVKECPTPLTRTRYTQSSKHSMSTNIKLPKKGSTQHDYHYDHLPATMTTSTAQHQPQGNYKPLRQIR